MRPRHAQPLPPEQLRLLKRAQHLEWGTIAVLACTATLMYLVMGNSQAMKTALAEDVLSLVPSLALIIAARFSRRPADATYVNGRERAFDIALLVSAVALTGVGGWLVLDSLLVLINGEHPTIAGTEIFGTYLWQGWLMIGALLVATAGPMLMGHLKMKVARQLQLKPLHTDAEIDKADWMTAVAGIAGVIGIGLGWWWADALAAMAIAGGILRDGLRSLRQAVRELHDAYPQTLERSDRDPLVERIRAAVLGLDWVADCELRLHEEGLRLSGVLFVTPRDQHDLPARLAQARQVAQQVHWRVDEIVATLDQP